MQRSRTETDGGALASENADTSSDKPGKNPGRRKPKVSWGRLIHPGLVDPKSRPKGVDDGQSVQYSDTTHSALSALE